MTAQTLTVHEGYRIVTENGLHLPQRFSKSAQAWVYYTDMQYGRTFNTSFKTEKGAANFLYLQWFMDSPMEVKEAHVNSGQASDVLLKKLGLRRGQKW